MRSLSAVPPPLLGISMSSTALSIVALGHQPKPIVSTQYASVHHKVASTNPIQHTPHLQNQYHLHSYGITELSQAQMVDNQIVDVEQMGQAIAQLMYRLQLQAQQASTAMCQALTLSQHVVMPAWLLDVEIEAQICIDAEQYIPYPLAEVSFDFEVIAPVGKDGQGVATQDITLQPQSDEEAETLEILLVVTLTCHVEQMVDTLTFAGLNTQFIEVDAHAIERSLQLVCAQLPSCPPVVALIDIGHSRTTVYVVKQGVFVYQSEQLFGGNQLTQSLQAGYQLSAEEAQQVKIHWPNLPKQMQSTMAETETEGAEGTDNIGSIGNLEYADYVDQHLLPFVENLVSYVKQALQPYFQAEASKQQTQSRALKVNSKTTAESNSPSQDSSPQIEQVILCGGSAALSQLDDILQDKLGLPVLVANPFEYMSVSPTIDKAQLIQDAPRLMTACGLSLRACAEAQHKKKGWLWRR